MRARAETDLDDADTRSRLVQGNGGASYLNHEHTMKMVLTEIEGSFSLRLRERGEACTVDWQRNGDLWWGGG